METTKGVVVKKYGKWAGAAVAGIILVAGSAPLSAQVMVQSPVRFGIAGGATLPVNDDFKDISKTGWHAGALLDIGLPLVPIGFRIDAMWNQLAEKELGSGLSIKNRIINGTANATYSFGSVSPTKFYLIGGVGVYNLKTEVEGVVPPVLNDVRTQDDWRGSRVIARQVSAPPSQVNALSQADFSVDNSDSRTKFGINGGVGLRFQLTGFATFIEARWHSIFTEGANVQMVPISVGFTF